MPAAVNRPLNLATPVEKGADVRALQSAINRQFKHVKIDRSIRVDGDFGAQTFRAATQVAICLGVTGKALAKLRRGTVSEGAQRLIRGRQHTKREALVAKARAPYRRKLRKRYAKAPGEKAVARGRKLIGTTERPPGSNKGPGITNWQVFTGYTWVKNAAAGVFWCGCFACWVVVKLGGARVPDRIRLGFAPYITEDALAGRNGLTAVPSEDARPGDIACLWGGKHIEVVAERPVNGSVRLLGGNTSKGGQESNGGGVFENTRSLSEFDRGIVARPHYA